MTVEPAALPIVRPIDILSGLGVLKRNDLCQMIALIECVDGLFLTSGVFEPIGAKLGLATEVAAKRLQTAQDKLATSSATDAALRFRLWSRLSEALGLPSTVPSLSGKSATRSASAFAVRASERLSPSIRARERSAHRSDSDGGIGELVGGKAAEYWKSAQAKVVAEPPLPFSEIVAKEMLAIFSNDTVLEAAAQTVDPEIAEALRQGHARAGKALAAGGAWAGGAAVVAQAGFLPYVLAAQLSAIIPLVSGPTLVSLLATLVNPLTVLVGIASIGWFGMGRGSRLVRSQLAARLGLLTAVQGSQQSTTGLNQFLEDMRVLDREPPKSFDWMTAADRTDMRRWIAEITGRLNGPFPPPAGRPPEPWSTKKVIPDVSDAVLALGLSAGEILWHAVALDPDVMKAADFSRSEDIGDPLTFALKATDFMTSGAGWSLRGYTAERLVLHKLIADGHDVSLAEASNTPGLDLVVDGMPVQVKCGIELSNLTEHFEKYPDIPVIANAELAEKALASGAHWAHLVTTVPGFEISVIEEQIAETLGHAVALADPDVLHFALSLGLLRGGIEVAKGRIPVADLPAWLILDGASRGLLVYAGGNIGAWFGLVAIGPAGALILGPAIGAAALLGNNALKDYAQRKLMADWRSDLQQAAEALEESIITALEHRIVLLEERTGRIATNASRSEIDGWIARRSQDDLVAALEDRVSLITSRPKAEMDAFRLLFSARDIAPADGAVLLRIHDLEQSISRKPALNDAIIEAGRRGSGLLRSRLNGRLLKRHNPEAHEGE